MRRRISILPALAALLVMAVAAVLFYGLDPRADIQAPLIPPEDTPMQVAQSQDERLLNMNSVITEDLIIYWVTHFTRCGHDQVRKAAPASDEIGMTMQEFADYHTGYTLTLSGTVLHMRREVAQYCPSHYVIWYVDGNLGLYRNVNATANLELITRLKYEPDEFSEDFLKLAADGIACDTLEKVEAVLEDASS